MSKKKRPNKVTTPVAVAPPKKPVLEGDVFVRFIDEARSIGNEVAARRQYEDDVVAYLTTKGLFQEWSAWRAAKYAPKT